MNPALKIITRLPLHELWRDTGFVTTTRLRSLTADDITTLLRAGHVQFVVADVGAPPRWISLSDCFDFWKTDVRPHLAEPDAHAVLDEYPNAFCYFASEWTGEDNAPPLVVLEKRH